MRILRKRELAAKIGLSAMHLGRLERANKFPKRIRLGPNAVGWIEEEVERWIEERAAERGSLPRPEKAAEALVETRRRRQALGAAGTASA